MLTFVPLPASRTRLSFRTIRSTSRRPTLRLPGARGAGAPEKRPPAAAASRTAGARKKKKHRVMSTSRLASAPDEAQGLLLVSGVAPAGYCVDPLPELFHRGAVE